MKNLLTLTVLGGAFIVPVKSSSCLPIVNEPAGIETIPKGFSLNHLYLDLTPTNSPRSFEPHPYIMVIKNVYNIAFFIFIIFPKKGRKPKVFFVKTQRNNYILT